MGQTARDRGSDHDALISVASAAALLGVHPNTLRAWTDAGRLTAYRINPRGDRRYRRHEVERLLAEGAAADEGSGDASARDDRDLELAVLARLTQRGPASASPTSVCRTAVEALRAAMGVARVAIYIIRDGSGGALHLETHAGYSVAPPDSIESPTDGGDHEIGNELGRRALEPGGVQIPLRAGGELLGILALADEPDGPLTHSRASFLRLVAGAISADLLSARTLARARREVTRARALRHVTQELTGQLDLNAVLEDIVDRTRSLFDADRAGLWLLEDAEQPFVPVASRGLSDEFHAVVRELTLASPAMGVRAVRERRTFVVRDADQRDDIGPMERVYRTEQIRTACLVPLVSNDRAVGVIGLYHSRDRHWPEDELALAQSFANQAAVAIANARLYRSVADQAARMRSIQDLSARLNRLTDVQAIADAIVAEASTLAAYHDIRVYRVDWDTHTCEPVAFTDRLLGVGDFREALQVDVGEGSFTGWVAENGEPILANDALHDPRGHTIEGTDDIEESMLVVPMVFEGRAVGVIALSKLGKDQFSTDDLQTMTIFAGYAAQAVANATAYERLEQQSSELARQLQSQRRLLEINERLLSTLDRQAVLETIADGLRSVVRYDNLSIYRTDEIHRVLVPVLTRERHADEVAAYQVPFGSGLMGWAVDHAEPVLANDALNDPRAMQIPGTPNDPEALIVVPLVADDEAIGCLNISRVGGPEAHFSQADFELVKLFAGQASIALRNAEAHQAMSLRADTDALTGLGNHGAFQRALSHALGQPDGARPQRRRTAAHEPTEPVALLMMDLDNFKAYNDRLGHPAGDALLHAVGMAIYGASRSDDNVFRYGGDEFAMVLPGVDAAGAEVVAERVREAVGRLTAGEPTPVTIAVGIAAHPEDALHKNDLIAAADTALYFGKQAGGDRIVCATEVPRDIRDLRGTLDRLARAALQHPEDPARVDSLVQAARRTAAQGPGEQTVRDALLAVARSLDTTDVAVLGHGERVGRLARRVAETMGMGGDEAATIELAARLHGLEALGAAELDPIPSLRDVGRLIRAHRPEDGAAERPVGAQIIAAVNAYDMLLTGANGVRRGRREAIEELRTAGHLQLSGAVLDALADLVSVADQRDARRRHTDALAQEHGAA